MVKTRENCSSCPLQSSTQVSVTHISQLWTCIIFSICVSLLTFSDGSIPSSVHTQIVKVSLTFQHKNQRCPAEHDPRKTQTLHQACDQSDPVANLQPSSLTAKHLVLFCACSCFRLSMRTSNVLEGQDITDWGVNSVLQHYSDYFIKYQISLILILALACTIQTYLYLLPNRQHAHI